MTTDQSRVSVTTSLPILAFSWGYAGWGTHTKELVTTVDAIERARGFAAPVFVDIRLRRQVRAVGFRERAFEALLGPKRYVWMNGLGNRAIANADRDGEIEIDDPAQADDLLSLILERAPRQRVIFFCSCGSPLVRKDCHRGAIVDLLVGRIRRRRVKVAVQEWPGGDPTVATVPVTITDLRKLRRGATRLLVPSNMSPTTAAALPHFSFLRCVADGEVVVAASGAATYTARGWMFPIYSVTDADGLAAMQAELEDDFDEHQLGRFGAPAVASRPKR